MMFSELAEVVGFLAALILLLQNIHSDMATPEEPERDEDATVIQPFHRVHNTLNEMDRIISPVLHDFRISSVGLLLDEDLGWWVKPRSKVWFSVFLLTVYDDERWIHNFRMTKQTIFNLARILQPFIEKQDTKFRQAIPVRVRVAVAVYKLVQGAPLLIVSENFAIGLSTVSKLLREVVYAINECFKNEIKWPDRAQAQVNMGEFQEWCGLPGIIGAIDGTHFSISKPSHFSEDYFYFKTNGYSMVCQAIVSRQKKFLDVYVGLPGSMNDVRVLRRSGLYRKARDGNLIDGLPLRHEGFPPYLLGDKGYPLLPWVMTPHREGRLTVLEEIYNRKHKPGRSVVENSFGIFKQSFQELMKKSELHVTFLPDVVMACYYLHNMLLGQDPHEVELLMERLQIDGLANDNDAKDLDIPPPQEDNLQIPEAQEMWQELGLYLGRLRNIL